MRSAPHSIPIRPHVQSAEGSLRPTRAEVDLAAIAHNLRVVRRAAGGASVLAVVKADAYGHGVVPVARCLQREGVDGFGVALAEEGLELRDAGVGAPIIVLNGVYGGAHGEVLAANLTPVVYDLGTVAEFQRASRGGPVDVHLKVDTGMGRLGVPDRQLDDFLDRLSTYQAVRIRGLMSHLATADQDSQFVAEQLRRFELAWKKVRARGHTPDTVHVANSAATFAHPSARYDMVRPGIALYGYCPVRGMGAGLRPALRLRTEVISIRELSPGDTVGYDRTFRARRPTRVATIPVGYGDGLMRSTSNRAQALVGGRRCSVVGNVSMDLTTLDVTEVDHVRVGQEVVLLGEDQGLRIGAEELARDSGTIAYEVLTNVSRRVPRVYC